ncbi:MAG: hypothetical protein HY834_10075 [Devosia nanyangense]|uniref:Uncharacterized protein n=1 Tax=Devosia nanyangense TaxID=1228055 RepID=A0A933NYJ2_9HYPH|nr:hypothetical protein [Devosia nanyangense]
MKMADTSLVQFSISKGDLAVSGAVPAAYFEASVQPAMDKLLQEIASRSSGQSAPEQSGAAAKTGASGPLDLSVKTICQRLSAKTGSDLLKAGAVSLALVQGQQQFTRKEILAEAQKAAGYWKASYSNDAGRYVTTLQSQVFLIEASSGQLSLSAKAESEMMELLTREA